MAEDDDRLFVNNIRMAITWTQEISDYLLLLVAEDVCNDLTATGDPVVAFRTAIESGFDGPGEAEVFLEEATHFYCPEFSGVV